MHVVNKMYLFRRQK